MAPKINYAAALKSFKRLALILLTLSFNPFIAMHGLAQSKQVEVNLTNYPYHPSTLTPSIEVDAVQFQPPNAAILVDGVDINTIPWLKFNGAEVGDKYKIDLYVPNTTPAQCVPWPAGVVTCSDPDIACTGGGFVGATRKQCYRIEVTAYGTTTEHSLCVFGPEPIAFMGASSFQGISGQQKQLPFSISRPEEHYTWSLKEAMPDYFTWSGGDNTGKDAILIFNPPSDSELPETTYHMQVVNSNQACDKAEFTFKVSSTKEYIFVNGPVDIVLVVDLSGSMGSTAKCDCSGSSCPSPPGGSKLKYLKTELFSLYNQMKALARPEDRIGLVSFHTTSKIEVNLGSIVNDASIIPAISAWPDQGFDYTAIGQGLLDARSLLSDATRKRYIILMTNGMQNEPPELEWTNPSHNTVKVGSTVFDTNLGIKVMPIAIFTPSGEYRNLLNALGTGTGVSVVKDVCESNLSLLKAYTDASKAMGSPKLVTFKRGAFSGGSAIETFTVNENLDQMLVNIINVGNQNFTSFKLEKNIGGTWTDLTALGTIIPAIAQTSVKRLFTITFPAMLGGSPINSAGEYRCTVNSSLPNIPYEFNVIIDDRGVKHGVFIGDGYHQAGEPISLSAITYYNGQPITNANVVVSLESPVASFSSKFSNADIPGQYLQVTKVPLVEGRKGGFGMPYINQYNITHPSVTALRVDADRMSISDKKYHVLTEQGLFTGAFESRGESVPLTHDTHGVYKGKFTNTSRVGLYTMHFLIQGNVSGLGAITRMDATNVYVNFGKPVLSESEFHLMWEEPLVLSMKPKDTSGNLLGPGHGDQISIYLSKGSASVPTDYLDGRYVIRLFGISDNDDPDLIIRVKKDVLFNGKLSDVRRKRGFFSILGGYTFPQTDLDSEYDGNFTAEAKLGYRFWKKVGAQVHLGYYSFETASENPNLNTFGGGLGLFYRLPLSSGQGWNMIAEVNGGYYKPKDIDGEFGFNGGLGLNAFLNYNLSLVIEAKYYSIQTSPSTMNFLSTVAGLKFHF